MSVPVDGATRARPPADDGGAQLAARVVAEVTEVAGGRLRPESAERLRELTVRGYRVFASLLAGEEPGPEVMAELVDGLFDDIQISLEDAMALHRHLEQVLLREVRKTGPAPLASADPGLLESAAHRFFNDLAGALADGYLAARRGHDGDRDSAERELVGCLVA